MGVKTLIFMGLFAFCTVGALFNPLLGVLGYVAHYMIGPERQWWERPVQSLGLRYSLVLASATFAGMVFNARRLRFGKSWFCGQEKFLLLFLAAVWLVTLISPETVGRYSTIDHPSVKFTKIALFVMMMTHIVTDTRKLNHLLWVLVVSALLLGLQAYDTPRRAFAGGRLNSVGGVDFAEANYFAAFMVALLPIIAAQFMRSGLAGKALCAVAGAFTANAIILTRSRGAFVGMAGSGLTLLVLAPRKYRVKILAGLLVAALGVYYVSDPQFRARAMTITSSAEERDASAQSRVRLAEAGVKMLWDHPQGVGVGNFYQNIGRYIPEYARKDAHNMYVRCFTETGVLGFAMFAAVISCCLLGLRQELKRAGGLPADHQHPMFYTALGMAAGMVGYLFCGLTMSLTYVESTWLLLFLPVCLTRAVDNREEDRKLPAAAPGFKAGKLKGKAVGRQPKRKTQPAGAH